ncbi:MAG: OmpA family protein [Actinomycetia bacterium]|nr:OmpA family protein [Actinomycetes bacterium]
MTEEEGLPAWAVIADGGVGRTTQEIVLEPPTDGRRPRLRIALRIGALVLAMALGFLIAQFIDANPFSASELEATSTGEADDGVGLTDQSGGGTGDGDEVASLPVVSTVHIDNTTVEPAAPELVSAEVDLLIADNHLTLRAVVADADLGERLEATVAEASGSFGASTITVEPSAAPEPWLGQLPEVVARFAHLIDGSITIEADQVVITGRASSQDSVDDLVDLLSAANGFPPLTNQVEVVALTPAAVEVVVSKGELTLVGVVPSDAIRQDLVVAVTTAYEEGTVIDELEIDETTFAGFDVLRLPVEIVTFSPGGDFTVGVSEGAFSAVLADAISFEEAESVLTADSRQLMTSVAQVINRSGSTVTIVGHTDDVGSDEDNMALSENRASTVADYLISQGVDRAMVEALGQGESEPVTSNETEDGRERNRRVVITIIEDRA